MRKNYLKQIIVSAICLQIPAFAYAESFTYEGMNFYMEEDGVWVGDNASMEGDVVIPSEVVYQDTTYPVKGIYDWAFNWSSITSVVIPETVTAIGMQAFGGCQNLTHVDIPASVKTIGEYAFDNSGLMSIYVPPTVESVGMSAFQGINNLTSCDVAVKDIPENMFANCWNLSEIKLHDTVETIGSYAFSGPNNITELTLPYSLKSIGMYAFQMISLSRLTIPSSLEYLGDGAFAYNNYVTLEELVIEDSDTALNIDGSPFFMMPVAKIYQGRDIPGGVNCDCFPLVEYTTGGGCTSLEGLNFCCYALEKLTMHEGLKTIGEGAVSLCDLLTELTVPSTVTAIGKNSLNILTGLQSLTFLDCDEPLEIGENVLAVADPKTVYVGRELTGEPMYFGYGALEYLTLGGGCRTAASWMQRSALKEVILKEGVERIEKDAFSQCSQLARIEIPSTVTYIGEQAFNYCESLTEAILPDGVEYIGDSAFSGCPITELNLGENLSYLGGWSFSGTRIKEVVIPDGLEQIQWCAFLDCKELTDVTIGSGVTFIDTSAFGGLDALENLTIADSDANLSMSGMGVFGGSPMKNLYLGRLIHGSWFTQTNLESLELGGACTGAGGWNNAARLQKIVLDENVAEIQSEAFAGSAVIHDIEVKSIVPCLLPENAFLNDVYSNATLSVPAQAVESYRNAQGWNLFAHVNGISVGIDEISTCGSYVVYDINGNRIMENASSENLRELVPGIYIINGRKVVVK